MHFNLRVLRGQDGSPPKELTVEGDNWYGALVNGLASLDDRLGRGELCFQLLDDGQSAIVRDPWHARRFELTALPGRIEAASVDIPRTFEVGGYTARPISRRVVLPRVSGRTAIDLLVTNPSELRQRFGLDREAAARRVIEMASVLLDAANGGVIFGDGVPRETPLRFRSTFGSAWDRLEGRQVTVGQGPCGVCVHLGVSLNIANLAQDVRLSGGVVGELRLDVGPMMCVPIVGSEWFLGVIALARPRRAAPLHRRGAGRAQELVCLLRRVSLGV